MLKLVPADEYFYHQIPEPHLNVVTHHEHWRDSYFFILHPRNDPGDVIILTMAHYPARGIMDSLQLGRIQNQPIFVHHTRPYGNDPHTPRVGPVSIDIVEPFKTIKLSVDGESSPVGLDLTFTARTRAYGLRRGTMKAGHEIIWDQSHLFQSGNYSGTYFYEGKSYPVSNWWGQRDHSWGIRDHGRCPMWMWLAVQLPDGMFGVWHWEYANGARVYSDGCFAPADGSDPIPLRDFHHELQWMDEDDRPVEYGKDGSNVKKLSGRVTFVLEGGKCVNIDAVGSWCAPYEPFHCGGLNQMIVKTDDGRVGTAIYEITGSSHYRYFNLPRGENLPA
jgi:hypothetical protein